MVSDIIDLVSDIIDLSFKVWLLTWRPAMSLAVTLSQFEFSQNHLKSFHISGIEWSISFFTNELDMLKRYGENIAQTLYLVLSVERLTSWLWYCRCRWGWWWWWWQRPPPRSPLPPSVNQTIEISARIKETYECYCQRGQKHHICWLFKTIKKPIGTCLFVLHPNHILAIHLQQLVLDKQPIPSRFKYFNCGSRG